ncbi:10204_t:CDS:1, partial [Acaulospora morrowiae]
RSIWKSEIATAYLRSIWKSEIAAIYLVVNNSFDIMLISNAKKLFIQTFLSVSEKKNSM